MNLSVAHTKENEFSSKISQTNYPIKTALNDNADTDAEEKHLYVSQNHVGTYTEEKQSCTICQTYFDSITSVSYNCIHEKIKKYSCEFCHLQFDNLSKFEKHGNVHTNIKPYTCIYCQIKFIQKESFDHHHWLKHVVTQVSCDICNQCFTSEDELALHKKTHIVKKRYICKESDISINFCKIEDTQTICGDLNKRSAEENKFTLQKKQHVLEKPYFCKECNTGFALETDLSIHCCDIEDTKFICDDNKISAEEKLTFCKKEEMLKKPYVCEECGTRFTSETDKLMHSCEHKFLCDVCNRCFVTQRQLNSHKPYHSKKKYVCKVCQKHFKKKSQLEAHSAIHAEKKSFLCDSCQRGFTTKPGLITHLRRFHDVHIFNF